MKWPQFFRRIKPRSVGVRFHGMNTLTREVYGMRSDFRPFTLTFSNFNTDIESLLIKNHLALSCIIRDAKGGGFEIVFQDSIIGRGDYS